MGVGDLHLVPPRSDRCHQHAARVQVGVLVGVGQGADDPDLQPRLGQPLGDPLSPLDDGDRLVERGVEIEVVELVGAAEPVGVDVHQRRAAGHRRVLAGDHERRRGDVAAHREPRADALGERRLAGAELAAEHDQVAGPELLGEGLAEGAHRRRHPGRRTGRCGVAGAARRTGSSAGSPGTRGAPRTRWSRAAPRGRPRSGRRSRLLRPRRRRSAGRRCHVPARTG